MPLLLGPMPISVRKAVSDLVQSAREASAQSNHEFIGHCLWCGPGGFDYIDANGEVWAQDLWRDSLEQIADGPRKVAAIAIAAKRTPELAAWLPRRPSSAVNCSMCSARGWLDVARHTFLCTACHGMGWVDH